VHEGPAVVPPVEPVPSPEPGVLGPPSVEWVPVGVVTVGRSWASWDATGSAGSAAGAGEEAGAGVGAEELTGTGATTGGA